MNAAGVYSKQYGIYNKLLALNKYHTTEKNIRDAEDNLIGQDNLFKSA